MFTPVDLAKAIHCSFCQVIYMLAMRLNSWTVESN